MKSTSLTFRLGSCLALLALALVRPSAAANADKPLLVDGTVITLADSTARRVRAKTISGSLTCDLDNPPSDSEIKLETTSGEITARVREDSDLHVTLYAVSGRVTCAFQELHHEGAQSVSGTLGKGTGQLYANATSGNISLLRRPVDYEVEE